jgi:uncharacterized membrane protein
MTTLSILPIGLRRRILQRSEIERLLIASTFFSCFLVALRVFHTRTPQFMFMGWNLFLAYLPYLLSAWLTAKQICRSFLFILSTVWLLFIPNTFYMLTDLFHLIDRRNPQSPAWYDLALIFSFAWNGLLLGVLSVRQMQKLLVPGQSVLRGNVFLYCTMFLCSLGVYIGRYLRYNSWDVVSNPLQLTADIVGMIIHPMRNHLAWGMIGCFTILLCFIYNMLKKMSQALA